MFLGRDIKSASELMDKCLYIFHEAYTFRFSVLNRIASDVSFLHAQFLSLAGGGRQRLVTVICSYEGIVFFFSASLSGFETPGWLGSLFLACGDRLYETYLYSPFMGV
jgi:hypothetical protein